eukprot:6202674-Pleurochrysis_carterae.AAC.1
MDVSAKNAIVRGTGGVFARTRKRNVTVLFFQFYYWAIYALLFANAPFAKLSDDRQKLICCVSLRSNYED